MQLSGPQYKFLQSSAQWVVYGGAAGGGKTHALTIDPLRHAQGPTAQGNFRGSIFRRKYPQITNPGGLLDHCKGLYGPLRAPYNHTDKEFRFPCGAKITLGSVQYDKDLDNFMGSQYDWIAFDEATQFPEKFVLALWGRCRSKTGIKPALRMSCNPDNDSWLYKFLFWWLDPATGFPIPDRDGVIRHWIRRDEAFEWFDEPQYRVNEVTGVRECVTTSATFIRAVLSDNSALLESDPQYRQNLESLPDQDRQRFLEGCWLASSKGDTEWDRSLFLDTFVTLDQFPRPSFREVVRFFSVDPSKGRSVRVGDYSSICCVAQTEDLKYVDADLERRNPTQIIEDLFLFCEQEHHKIRTGDLIGIESLQFQELLRDMIMQYAISHPEYALSRYLATGNIIIPVKDTLPKNFRIRRLSPYITGREFRFLQNPGTALLVSQLRNWDGGNEKGKHDDGPDSLDMCLQLPYQLQRFYEEGE